MAVRPRPYIMPTMLGEHVGGSPIGHMVQSASHTVMLLALSDEGTPPGTPARWRLYLFPGCVQRERRGLFGWGWKLCTGGIQCHSWQTPTLGGRWEVDLVEQLQLRGVRLDTASRPAVVSGAAVSSSGLEWVTCFGNDPVWVDSGSLTAWSRD